MIPRARVRARGIPTDYITRAKEDGRSPFPPKGGKGGSLTVRRAVRFLGSPPRGIQGS